MAGGGEGPGARSREAPGGDPGCDPVRIPVEDHLDLHPFAPRDVPSVVEEYLEAAYAAGLREVRLIHGRGIGAQREAVRRACARHPRVEAYEDATADRGGWGATVVRLRASAARG